MCVCVCVCICMCVCVYIYIYIKTHTQSAPSAYPPCLKRRRRCPSVPILAASHYIPQSQPQYNYLTQIRHYVEIPIKFPQNHNHFIFQALFLPARILSGSRTPLAQGFGPPISRHCAGYKTSLHLALAHRLK